MLVPLFAFNFKNAKLRLAFIAVVFISVGVFGGYALYNANDLWRRVGAITNIEVLLSTIMVVFVLAFAWKIVGPVLPVLAIICLIYAMIGPYLPIAIGHRGYTWARLMELMFMGTNGVLGTSLGVSSTYVAIFIIFASILESSGAGSVFINLTQSALGGFRGGPAKVAVVASSLVGIISGSAVANAVATGPLTIPLMKRTGFKAEFAAAVEAAASSGGQLIPPVMGAAAFIMAEIIGSYQVVIAAAIIPAVLYYVALFVMVDLEALKHGYHGQPRSQLPKFLGELKTGWLLITPLGLLIYMLVVMRYSPPRSAYYAIMMILLIVLLVPGFRQNPFSVFKGLALSAKGIPSIALITGTSGILVGILMLTGLGHRLSNILVDLSGGNVYLLLLFTMIASLILGLGLPTSGAYILLAALVVPAMEQIGVAQISAHFFVFYFGVMANVTPPVAVASIATAGIANADPIRTCFIAWRLCLNGFILPFIFALNPALLGHGTVGEVALAIIIALIGTSALAMVLQRFFLRRMNIVEILLMSVFIVSLIIPGLQYSLIGMAGIILIAALHVLRHRRSVSKVA
jgi:TRAP transporter 4TM/12TM fusion protein